MTSENDFAILNAIYLKKMATAETIADVTGVDPELVRERLDAAAQDGRVLALPDGAMLLEAGTSEVLATYHRTYEEIRVQEDVLHWYERFEVINSRFIGQVTEWQQSDGDEKAERRLLQSAERLMRDLDGLLGRVPRYANYQRRFQRSMNLVDQGQRDFICKPTLDSVHNIWFEFHEDILAVLGRPRDTT
jgi:hypothetical protein